MSGFVAWAQTVDWQAWAMLANAAAILIAATVAARTANQVLSERAVRRTSEVAEDLLSRAYQADDIFKELRNPFSFARGDDLDLSAQERMHKEFSARLERTSDFFQSCYNLRPLIRAYFGQEIAEQFSIIFRIRNQVIFAVEDQLSMIGRRLDDDEIAAQKANRKVIYAGRSDDPIEKEITEMYQSLEAKLLRYVRVPGRS